MKAQLELKLFEGRVEPESPEELNPRSYEGLVQLIGDQALFALGEKRAGTFLFVPAPENLKPDHWICGAIGQELAAKLAYHFGPGRLYIPMGTRKVWSDRNAEIRHKFSLGKSMTQLAREYGLSISRICQLVNKKKA